MVGVGPARTAPRGLPVRPTRSPLATLVRTRAQWVFYLFAAMAFLWLPFWLPLRVTNSEQPSAAGLLKASGAGLSPGPSPRAQDMGGAAVQDPEEAQGLLSASQQSQQQAAAAGGKRGFWALMRRREVWAICAAQYCQSWGMYGLLNWLPTFFK